MPEYGEINWDKAECRGEDTEMFFRIEEERNYLAYRYINAVRSICSRCPIWRDCLAYAFQNEQFGMWGGLTSLERKSVADPNEYPIQLGRALDHLQLYGINYKDVKEAYVYSTDV